MNRFSFLWVFVFVVACAPQEASQLSIFTYPAHFPAPLPEPNRNPGTKEGIELGRMLFDEEALSPQRDISCASCHKSDLHFADSTPFSTGHQGNKTMRNTPALINLAWAPKLFWDGGGSNLESVSLAPLHQEGEMGWKDLKALEDRLNKMPLYPPLFKKVFGSDTIEIAHAIRALAQYQRSLLHADSRWDNWFQKKEKLTTQELEGWTLFERHCSNCHTPPLFTNYSFYKATSDSLPINLSLEHADRGRNRITHSKTELGFFRTPTLRGLAKTNPYFHDGRFKNLEDLMQSADFESRHAAKFLTPNQKQLLIAFLRTLD